jgi:hypothetical protein
MRGIAVLLLVSFHVIGSGPKAGLYLDYPHPLRFFADGLINMRMPLFAFIAGYVYGLKPIGAGSYLDFIQGKFRRLFIPGCIAALCLLAASHVMGTRFGDVSPIRAIFFSYAHFWFLQAILVIFVIYGGCEAFFGQRVIWIVFPLAIAAYLLKVRLPTSFMSVNYATYLLPYFLLGLIFLRHSANFTARKWLVAGVALLCLAWTIHLNIAYYHETGKLILSRRLWFVLASGFSICLLMVLFLPRIAILEWLGPFSFTIYLYHVLGAAGSREILQYAGVTDLALLFLGAFAGGLILPSLLHLWSGSFSLSRLLVLGKRPQAFL